MKLVKILLQKVQKISSLSRDCKFISSFCFTHSSINFYSFDTSNFFFFFSKFLEKNWNKFFLLRQCNDNTMQKKKKKVVSKNSRTTHKSHVFESVCNWNFYTYVCECMYVCMWLLTVSFRICTLVLLLTCICVYRHIYIYIISCFFFYFLNYLIKGFFFGQFKCWLCM